MLFQNLELKLTKKLILVFFEKSRKVDFFDFFKKPVKIMSDSAFFYVIRPNLLIYEQKIHKKVVGCFDVILS
jgi:hypothetical protein